MQRQLVFAVLDSLRNVPARGVPEPRRRAATSASALFGGLIRSLDDCVPFSWTELLELKPKHKELVRQARRTHEGYRDRGLALGAHASSGKPSGRQLLKLAEPKSDAPNGTKSPWKSCLYLSRYQVRYLSGINFLKTEQKDPAEEKVLLVKGPVIDSTGPLWPQPWWAMDRGGCEVWGENLQTKMTSPRPASASQRRGAAPTGSCQHLTACGPTFSRNFPY